MANSYTISRVAFTKALDAVKGTVPNKPMSPLLTHVEVSGGWLRAYDGQMGIQVPIELDKSITFNFKFHPVRNLLRALSDDTVKLTLERDKLRLECGAHKSLWPILGERIPQPNEVIDGVWYEVPMGLNDSLARAISAASTSESDLILQCVYIKGQHVYGTNRSTIVRCVLSDELPEMLLGPDSVREVIHLGQPSHVCVGKSWARWRYGESMLSTRLREGTKDFPPVDTFLARLKYPAELEPIPAGLLPALTRIAMIAKDDLTVKVVPAGANISLVVERMDVSILETLDTPGQSPPAKKFDPTLTLGSLPFADGMHWGFTEQDPIHLRNSETGFEFYQGAKV